jgi:ABC-2 type transport system permease protein
VAKAAEDVTAVAGQSITAEEGATDLPVVGSATDTTQLESSLVAFTRAVRIVWQRELIRFSRSTMRLTTSLAQPILYLFVFGVGLGQLIGGSVPGFDFKAFLFPGIVIMSIIFSAVFSAVSIVWDREFGFMREMLVAPVPRGGLIVGKALGGATVSTIQGALVLVLAPAAGVHLKPASLLIGLAIMALAAFTLTSFGIVIAARIQRIESFQAVMQFFLMPLFFLSGALYPLETLPSWLKTLTALDPATYAVSALRRTFLGGQVSGFGSEIRWFGYTLGVAQEIAVLAAFGVAMCMLAVALFRRAE